MADTTPVTELLPLSSPGSAETPWPDATGHLTESPTFFLATARPDGRPHVMPVLGAWRDGSMYVCTPGMTRKARNLAGNENCVITVNRGPLDLVVEGRAKQVSAEDELRTVGEAYAAKYGWKFDVRGGEFFADNGGGEMPFAVFRIEPATGFGIDNSQGFSVTRWTF